MNNKRKNRSSEVVITPPQRNGFLKDGDGNNSTIRLISFVSLIAAILCSGGVFYLICIDKDAGELLKLVYTFLGVSVVPKTIQKHIEEKNVINR